jgi:hypothetical protein
MKQYTNHQKENDEDSIFHRELVAKVNAWYEAKIAAILTQEGRSAARKVRVRIMSKEDWWTRSIVSYNYYTADILECKTRAEVESIVVESMNEDEQLVAHLEHEFRNTVAGIPIHVPEGEL